MKKSFLYIFCICFPLIATANDKIIRHETCQIEIASNFGKLTDNYPGNYVPYNANTIQGIESLFYSRGYHPTKESSPNVMSLNINSTFKVEQRERYDEDIITMDDYDCWDVTVTIPRKGQKPIYENKYSDCRERVSLAIFAIYDSRDYEDYRAVILKDAVYNNMSSLSDSIDAVLLGARDSARKKYKSIPTNIGILNDIPYCCSPHDSTFLCEIFRKQSNYYPETYSRALFDNHQ
ncbi:MAG: hypothetical protein NTY22_01785 [Proteobacteria bacterium]|nr:hypothetical protein [Pseudomonadota bacterium]